MIYHVEVSLLAVLVPLLFCITEFIVSILSLRPGDGLCGGCWLQHSLRILWLLADCCSCLQFAWKTKTKAWQSVTQTTNRTLSIKVKFVLLLQPKPFGGWNFYFTLISGALSQFHHLVSSLSAFRIKWHCPYSCGDLSYTLATKAMVLFLFAANFTQVTARNHLLTNCRTHTSPCWKGTRGHRF